MGMRSYNTLRRMQTSRRRCRNSRHKVKVIGPNHEELGMPIVIMNKSCNQKVWVQNFRLSQVLTRLWILCFLDVASIVRGELTAWPVRARCIACIFPSLFRRPHVRSALLLLIYATTACLMSSRNWWLKSLENVLQELLKSSNKVQSSQLDKGKAVAESW